MALPLLAYAHEVRLTSYCLLEALLMVLCVSARSFFIIFCLTVALPVAPLNGFFWSEFSGYFFSFEIYFKWLSKFLAVAGAAFCPGDSFENSDVISITLTGTLRPFGSYLPLSLSHSLADT